MTETTSLKQSNTVIVVFCVAFVVSAIAASLLFVRTNSLQAKIDYLQSQLNAANWPITQLQPLAAQARKLPVAVACRKAVTGAGYVLTLHNMTSKPLALSVTISNPALNKTNTYRVDIDGGLMYQTGSPEGWALISGDQIEVENAEYDPFIAELP